MKTIYLLPIIGCLFATGFLFAQRPETLDSKIPTILDSINYKNVAAPSISPDGRFVAYLVEETNWDANQFETEIWIASLQTGEKYQLTNGKNSSRAARWSPDGKTIAFLSNREGSQQVYLISPAGGEPVRLTNAENGVNNMSWSPSGRHLAFTTNDSESQENIAQREKYGSFEVFESDGASSSGGGTTTHLWMIDVPLNGAEPLPTPRRLTEGKQFTVEYFKWSPDSERIAFSAPENSQPASRKTSDIYVLKVADKSLVKIVDSSGPDSYPIWSPDGRQIAYETMRGEPFRDYENSRVAVVSAEGGTTPRLLTEKFDERTDLIAWSPDGIYFVAPQKTYSHLFLLNPQTTEIKRLSAPDSFTLQSISFSYDGSQIAILSADRNNFPEVFVTQAKIFNPKKLTSSDDQFKNFKHASREVIKWQSTDGTPVEGVLIKPADFDSSKKYPLLVVIHGGPADVSRAILQKETEYPVEQFAAKGALILKPNYRGSIGYGEKFRSLNVRNFGIGDYADIVSGIDYLISQGNVDQKRIGAMGWSQGGYIAAFLATFGNKFKAVSAGAGVYDWKTYYTQSDTGRWVLDYMQATPWADPDIYRKTAVMSYLAQAKTPVLIQHGEFDRRAPTSGAYELFRGLQDHNVPVKMIIYHGAGHGVQGTPKGRLSLMKDNYEWFARWLWN